MGEAHSGDGSWVLNLNDTRFDQGKAPIEVQVQQTDGGAGVGLNLFVRPQMSDMDHLLPVQDFLEEEEGTYRGTVLFDMPGIWDLAGYVGDEAATEEFTFVVEVHP